MSPRRGWLLALAALVVASIALPAYLLDQGVARSRRCLASIEEPRGQALPDCGRYLPWFASLARLPWLRRDAERLHEELVMRMVVARYLDAAIGQPDTAQLRERFQTVVDAERQLERGSGRMRFDELGPPMPRPAAGQLAFAAGDAGSLDAHAFSLNQHYSEVHAIEAALLAANIERAVRLARHYAGRPNSDLRVRLGALLCLGEQVERGLDQVLQVERDRAGKRNANFARDFGDVRLVIEACASTAGRPVPGPPAYGDAGDLHQQERLLALRLRRMRVADPSCDLADPTADCRRDPDVHGPLEDLRSLLAGPPDASRFPIELFALAIGSLDWGDVEDALGRWQARLAPAPLLWPAQWIGWQPDQPYVSAGRFDEAAQQLRDRLPESEPARQLAGALWLRAARGFAQLGKLHEADRVIAQAVDAAPGRLARDAPLLRVVAALVAADRVAARRRLPAQDVALAERPQSLLLRGALTLPRRAEAKRLFSLALAGSSSASALQSHARWMLRALGQGPSHAPGETLAGSSSAPQEAVAAASGVALLEPSSSAWRDRRSPSGETLAGSSSASQAPQEAVAAATGVALVEPSSPARRDRRAPTGELRRAQRYTVYRQRGAAPKPLGAYLAATARLVDEASQVEPWLNAVVAIDGRRLSLREVAFARWQAAAWRGDAVAEALWRRRYRTLAGWAQSARTAELLHILRL